MGKKKHTRSDMAWFKFYACNYLPYIRVASTQTAGQVLKAVCFYMAEEEEEIPPLTDPFAQAIFNAIKQDVERSYEIYLKKVERGKLGGRPPKTIPNHTQPCETEQEPEQEPEPEQELEPEPELSGTSLSTYPPVSTVNLRSLLETN